MKDRNFAISSLLMAGMAMILYGSSVVIPQLAQQDLAIPPPGPAGAFAGRRVDRIDYPAGAEADAGGADALDYRFRFYLPGGVVLLVTYADPGYRFRNAGAVPQRPVDRAWVPVCSSHHHCFYFDTEAAERRCGGAVYHVPQRGGLNWHLAFYGGHYRTFPGAQRASAYHASPFNEQFQLAIRESAQAIQNFTTQVGDPTGIATGRMYQTMIEQSRFLAYIDVFTILSVVAMLLIPFCLLLSPVKSEGSAGAH